MKVALQCCIGFHCTVGISPNYIYMYLSPLEPPSPLPIPPLWVITEHQAGSLCCIVASHWLSVLYIIVYMCQRYFLNSTHTLLPPPCPQVQSG